jgi:hypothetical protein
MYGCVVRRVGWSQSEIVLYNRINWLHTVTHMAVAPLPAGHSLISSLDRFDSATSVFLCDQYYIIIIIIQCIIWIQI